MSHPSDSPRPPRSLFSELILRMDLRKTIRASQKPWAGGKIIGESAVFGDESFRAPKTLEELWLSALILKTKGHSPERETRVIEAIEAAARVSEEEKTTHDQGRRQTKSLTWRAAFGMVAQSGTLAIGQALAANNERQGLSLFLNQKFWSANGGEGLFDELRRLLRKIQDSSAENAKSQPVKESAREWQEKELGNFGCSSFRFQEPQKSERLRAVLSALDDYPIGLGFKKMFLAVASGGGETLDVLRSMTERIIREGRLDLFGQSVNGAQPAALSPLMQAIDGGDIEAIRFLAQYSDTNAADDNGANLLSVFCDAFDDSTLNPNAATLQQAESDARFIASLLTDETLRRVDDQGRNALWHAVRAGLPALASHLLDLGLPAIENGGSEGVLRTAISASESGWVGAALFRRLAEACPNGVRAKNPVVGGLMAAALIAEDCSAQSVAERLRLLISLGADPGAADAAGHTALHRLRFAPAWLNESDGVRKVARVLVRACDPFAKDKNGKTAFDLFAEPPSWMERRRLRLADPATLSRARAALAQAIEEIAEAMSARGADDQLREEFEKALKNKQWHVCEALSNWAPKGIDAKQLAKLSDAPKEWDRLAAAVERAQLRAAIAPDARDEPGSPLSPKPARNDASASPKGASARDSGDAGENKSAPRAARGRRL